MPTLYHEKLWFSQYCVQYKSTLLTLPLEVNQHLKNDGWIINPYLKNGGSIRVFEYRSQKCLGPNSCLFFGTGCKGDLLSWIGMLYCFKPWKNLTSKSMTFPSQHRKTTNNFKWYPGILRGLHPETQFLSRLLLKKEAFSGDTNRY